MWKIRAPFPCWNYKRRVFIYLSWYYISRDKYSDGLVPRITWVSKVLWKNVFEYSPEIERLSEISGSSKLYNFQRSTSNLVCFSITDFLNKFQYFWYYFWMRYKCLVAMNWILHSKNLSYIRLILLKLLRGIHHLQPVEKNVCFHYLQLEKMLVFNWLKPYFSYTVRYSWQFNFVSISSQNC